MENEFIKKDFEKRDYSFVVIPDPQNIVQLNKELYLEMMKWIKDNKDNYNIKAVFHMGDIVNRNTVEQWDTAKKGFDYIYESNIPFIPMLGNHDSVEMFNKYVKYDDYKDKPYFGGSYKEDSLEHFYWFVSANNREYLVLSLGWGPSKEVLNWFSDVIERNKNKNVIITSHALMHRNGKLLQKDHMFSITSYEGYENNPEGFEIWEHFKKYDNVILTLSGHISTSDISIYTENEVPSLLFDNQDEDKTRQLCMMGLLSFNNNNDNCFVNYYSFKEKALYKKENQFEIKINHMK